VAATAVPSAASRPGSPPSRCSPTPSGLQCAVEELAMTEDMRSISCVVSGRRGNVQTVLCRDARPPWDGGGGGGAGQPAAVEGMSGGLDTGPKSGLGPACLQGRASAPGPGPHTLPLLLATLHTTDQEAHQAVYNTDSQVSIAALGQLDELVEDKVELLGPGIDQLLSMCCLE
jgi:hypothetical protein